MPELKRVAPHKAIKYWETKKPLNSRDLKRLEEGAQNRAFYVTGLNKHRQTLHVYEALGRALKDGTTLEDFKKSVPNIIEEQGWNKRRLENIFRTNLSAAYAAGRWAEIEAGKEEFPYLEYVSVGDERTRPEHDAMDGLIYPVDHEFWQHNFPPNGFQCRCTTAPVSRHRADKTGAVIKAKMPGPKQVEGPNGYPIQVAAPGPDAGWHGNVGKDWLSGLAPEELTDVLSFRPPLETGAMFKPLEKISERFIDPIEAADILPAGQSDEFYIQEFLKLFGLKNINESTLITLPGLNLPVVISKDLFLNKETGTYKATKRGREVFTKLMAKAILNPYEIWQAAAVNPMGETYEVVRLIKLFRQPGSSRIGGFASFSLNFKGNGPVMWQSSTTFRPNHADSERSILNYLKNQRRGLGVYCVEDKKTGGHK